MQGFEFNPLEMKGAYCIKPFRAQDVRGEFIKDWSEEAFRANGIEHTLKETFYTVSKRAVIRALHFQLGRPQPKLVRCIKGHVYDVIADLRPTSPTFKRWQAFHLTGENALELLVPPFFGHGYLVVEESIVSYKCAEGFYPAGDAGIMWDDPDLAIDWQLDQIGGKQNLIISERDKKLMSLGEYLERISN